uniref:U5 small nuclear ribonucleoprotein TSSC4 n=1 Tax=Amphimedon queenslandica TaxID=400682 RepID=A0A1X7UYQ7_AMPQE
MELNDRLSLVFGSLKTKLQAVDDPPMKEEEYILDGVEERGTIEPVTSKRSHQFSERSRDHRHQRREGSRDHRRQFSERSRDHRPPRAPDYVHNPTKWTKYDLTDDGTSHQAGYEGLNEEQINRKAGLDFIYSLRDSKTTPTSIGRYDETNDGKIVFKRSTKRAGNEPSPGDVKIKKVKGESQLGDDDRDSTQSTDSGHYEGSVFKMPEYFVGLSNKPKRLSAAPPPETLLKPLPRHSVQLHLSHLEEEEED